MPEQQLPACSAVNVSSVGGSQPCTGLRALAASSPDLSVHLDSPRAALAPRRVPQLCMSAQPLSALFPVAQAAELGLVSVACPELPRRGSSRACSDADRTSPEESCSEGSGRILTCLSATVLSISLFPSDPKSSEQCGRRRGPGPGCPCCWPGMCPMAGWPVRSVLSPSGRAMPSHAQCSSPFPIASWAWLVWNSVAAATAYFLVIPGPCRQLGTR